MRVGARGEKRKPRGDFEKCNGSYVNPPRLYSLIRTACAFPSTPLLTNLSDYGLRSFRCLQRNREGRESRVRRIQLFLCYFTVSHAGQQTVTYVEQEHLKKTFRAGTADRIIRT